MDMNRLHSDDTFSTCSQITEYEIVFDTLLVVPPALTFNTLHIAAKNSPTRCDVKPDVGMIYALSLAIR